MFELLINPANAEKRPWEMFFVGLFQGMLALLLTSWIFAKDPVLSKYTGILMVTFSVMFCLPFVYFALKTEEGKDLTSRSSLQLLREHGKALAYFMFLFLGFVVAFSFWYIAFENGSNNFRAQIETYCLINRPAHFENCVADYGVSTITKTTTFLTAQQRIVNIFANNIYVLIFTLIFSLIFGAGAIFILAWNASVIAAAIGIFAQSKLSQLPLGLARYMIHGVPEILAYFIGALAGGIISVAVINHDVKTEKFWTILQDSLNLVILAVVVLFLAALIEVFITPVLF